MSKKNQKSFEVANQQQFGTTGDVFHFVLQEFQLLLAVLLQGCVCLAPIHLEGSPSDLWKRSLSKSCINCQSIQGHNTCICIYV